MSLYTTAYRLRNGISSFIITILDLRDHYSSPQEKMMRLRTKE
jgi:hypothetical protein